MGGTRIGGNLLMMNYMPLAHMPSVQVECKCQIPMPYDKCQCSEVPGELPCECPAEGDKWLIKTAMERLINATRSILARKLSLHTPYILLHTFHYYTPYLYIFLRPPPFRRPPERERVWVGHGGREADAKWVDASGRQIYVFFCFSK